MNKLIEPCSELSTFFTDKNSENFYYTIVTLGRKNYTASVTNKKVKNNKSPFSSLAYHRNNGHKSINNT